jgi:glucuronate isomerase
LAAREHIEPQSDNEILMGFLDENFLLRAETARRLYHDYAEQEPILDYHCHLPPKDIDQDRRFANLFEIWLEGDHYKWRAMRANGVEERFCTGDTSPEEKFMAWAETVPYTLRNPLYHWTHLELKRYFGINDLLDKRTARSIWQRANQMLGGNDLTARSILRKFRVTALCTTDDPADDLKHHKSIAASGFEVAVYPAFRPDRALEVHLPERWNAWIERLESAANCEIRTLTAFLDALAKRHDYFHSLGCRLSDHGLNFCPAEESSEKAAAAIFKSARDRKAASAQEHLQFSSFLMLYFGKLDARKGWTKQLHLGARRSVNSRMLSAVGPDTGFDTIGDFSQLDGLARFLDALERESALPKMVLYDLNPADNYAFAALIGCFQGAGVPGRIQFGSGWWFLDQKEGIELQLNALSNCGLLSRFIGMLTDSRSFMSFPRHEYFRRVLCDLLGSEIDRGEMPGDMGLVGGMVRNICYHNARSYLALPELRGQKAAR